MAIWLVRAGSVLPRHDFALDKNVVVAGWDEMPDLSNFATREQLEAACKQAYPAKQSNALKNWSRQLWAFAKTIQRGDLAIMPVRGQNVLAIGRVVGDYEYHSKNPSGARHVRPVEWIVQDMPRDRFDQDLLYSLGAFMTICQIQRNNAEQRIRAILEGRTSARPIAQAQETEAIDASAPRNFEEDSLTQIRAYITQKFSGHPLADLVDSVLQAQGYQTLVSERGADGGVDIIAGRGPMGFDSPHLCVQVKSSDQQQDVGVLRELRGVMRGYGAEQGVLVAWGGFKRSVFAEARRTFFEIRLWDADALIRSIFENYDQLTERVRAELPLKRVWMLVQEEDR